MLDQIFQPTASKRISAKNILLHPWFNDNKGIQIIEEAVENTNDDDKIEDD